MKVRNKNHGGIAVVENESETYSLQGSMIGRSDENGPQGDGINEDICFTLNTTDRHAVAAPEGGHYSTSKNSYHTSPVYEQANTLVASDWKDPPTVAGEAYSFYPQMKAESQCFQPELSNTLVNGTNPGFHNGVVQPEGPIYIVRRLTPVECARLQGFPDWWCADLAVPDPSDEEIAFWSDVWETWRQVTNPKGKPKTEKQIRKWLADPYTDSAEYKLWGNGCCLNNTFFVLAGIAWAAQREA